MKLLIRVSVIMVVISFLAGCGITRETELEELVIEIEDEHAELLESLIDSKGDFLVSQINGLKELRLIDEKIESLFEEIRIHRDALDHSSAEFDDLTILGGQLLEMLELNEDYKEKLTYCNINITNCAPDFVMRDLFSSYTDVWILTEGFSEDENIMEVYRAVHNTEVLGHVYLVSSYGYAGPNDGLQLFVAIDLDDNIAGIYVKNQDFTPGFDIWDSSNFSDLVGMHIKDYDQEDIVAGATKSNEALDNAIQIVIDYHNSQAFIISAQKTLPYSNALMVEHAANLLCAQTLCVNGDEFNLLTLSPYMTNLTEDYYDISESTVIAVSSEEGIQVYLEAIGTGKWEFTAGLVPSEYTRDESVIRDNN